MIKNIIGTQEQAGPVFFCDQCGEVIKSLVAGRVVLLGNNNEAAGTNFEVRHVHSGACHDQMEEQVGGEYNGFVDLDAHIRYLARNYGLMEVAPPPEINIG